MRDHGTLAAHRLLPRWAFLLASLLAYLGCGTARAGDEGGRMARELTPNLGWLNTPGPLRFAEELKGRVVVLDFWTHCCINCMHVLPDLEYLEEKYQDEPVVVIGVHSAKFSDEGTRASVRDAVRRYHVRHPVVIDDDMKIWRAFGVRAWPTLVVIDSRGLVVGAESGEGNREVIDRTIADLLERGRRDGTLARGGFTPTPDASFDSPGGLFYPGKVAVHAGAIEGLDAPEGILAIADSSNNRVIVARLPDERGEARVVRLVGSGERALRDDPDPSRAAFHDPQGLAIDADRGAIYVADRKNHALRRIDLKTWDVRTLAGDGRQGRDRLGGRQGVLQRLSSPWDVALSRDGKRLAIAMAGPHQIWEHDLEAGVTRALAGSGRENIVDGPADRAALAQPSGLALSRDGASLYFADSETSAIRRLKDGRVTTIAGVGLFEFGDVDGEYPLARLQHPLGVGVFADATGAERLLVADTYNNKLRLIDPEARRVGTLGPAGLTLREPGGVAIATIAGRATAFIADTNQHRIVRVELDAGNAWREVMLGGLDEPGLAVRATAMEVSASPGMDLSIDIGFVAPPGEHISAEAPISARVSAVSPGARAVAQETVPGDRTGVALVVPGTMVREGVRLRVDVAYATCTDGDRGLCIPRERAWELTLRGGTGGRVTLSTREP